MRSSFSAQPKYPLARKGSFYLSERQSGNGVLFGVLFNMALFDFLKDKKSGTAGAQPAEAKRQLVELALDSIVPNPAQPRKTFDDESISELAQSIRQVGLIQPLVVRKNGETYELIAGERRLRALRSLGSEKALCIVDNSAVDADSALMAVVENLQREDLNYFAEAECYKALLDELKLTQEELASRLGKSQSFIANKLRILKLSPEVREAVGLYGLSERHARAVLRLSDDADKLAIIKKAGEDGLSVKDTERLVEKKLNSLFDSKKDGIYVHMGRLGSFSFIVENGKLKTEGIDSLLRAGAKLVYKTGQTTLPTLGADVSGWTAAGSGGSVTADSGTKLAVAVSIGGKAALGALGEA